MTGFLILALALVAGWIAYQRLGPRRRHVEVLDRDGRHVLPGFSRPGQVILPVLAAGILVLILITSVRVVPVGHALVTFNTVTRTFGLARNGVNFVAPL